MTENQDSTPDGDFGNDGGDDGGDDATDSSITSAGKVRTMTRLIVQLCPSPPDVKIGGRESSRRRPFRGGNFKGRKMKPENPATVCLNRLCGDACLLECSPWSRPQSIGLWKHAPTLIWESFKVL